MMMARSIRLPAVAAVAVLVTAGPLGWSRDFGVFLFTLFMYLPMLVVVCVFFCIWAIVENRPGRRGPVLATVPVIIAVASAAFFGADHIHDQVAFLLWYPFNRQLVDQFAAKDGIIMTWDGWGIAGLENDSYLVSNTSDTISSTESASKWARQHQLDCDIVEVERMKRGLYIITTFNCSLD